MISFKIAGLGISFDFSFFAVAALFCLLDAPELALTAVCACIIHEMGHCMSALISGIKIKSVTFWAGGIRMVSDSALKSMPLEMYVIAAGPFISFSAALIYYIAGENQAFSVNFILGLFNMLPFSSLDGGALLRKIFDYYELNADFWMKLISIISGIFIMSFFIIFKTGNITGFLTLIILIVYEFIY